MNMEKHTRVDDTRKIVYARDGYKCQYPGCNICGWENLEMAHRIANTKSNLKYIQNFWWVEFQEFITIKQAEKIINHPINLVTSCSDHNSYFNCGFKRVETYRLLYQIKEVLDAEKK